MRPASLEKLPDVVAGCFEACRRCDAVVAAVIEQNPDAYSSVGPHLRHCIDHFQLLLHGWKTRSVDYDARVRDTRLERDPKAMREALEEIAAALGTISAADLGSKLTVTQSVAPGRPPVSSPTRLDRELIFLSGHAIHHIAIMVLAARSAGVVIPSQLGVAYSTEAFHDSLAVNG